MSADILLDQTEKEVLSSREILDTIVTESAHLLAFLDTVMRSVSVEEETGKIHFSRMTADAPKNISPELIQRYKQIHFNNGIEFWKNNGQAGPYLEEFFKK